MRSAADRHQRIVKRLSGPYDSLTSETGIALKPYPSCAATHAPIWGTVSLAQRRDVPIESVVVGVPEFSISPLIYPRPTTGLQGNFSMEYCVAAAILHGELGPDNFTDEAVGAAVATDIFSRVSMRVDERIAAAAEPISYLTATYADGTTDELLIDPAPGKPGRWWSEDTQRAQFDDCTKRGGVDSAALWQTIRECRAKARCRRFGVCSPQRTRHNIAWCRCLRSTT